MFEAGKKRTYTLLSKQFKQKNVHIWCANTISSFFDQLYCIILLFTGFKIECFSFAKWAAWQNVFNSRYTHLHTRDNCNTVSALKACKNGTLNYVLNINIALSLVLAWRACFLTNEIFESRTELLFKVVVTAMARLHRHNVASRDAKATVAALPWGKWCELTINVISYTCAFPESECPPWKEHLAVIIRHLCARQRPPGAKLDCLPVLKKENCF